MHQYYIAVDRQQYKMVSTPRSLGRSDVVVELYTYSELLTGRRNLDALTCTQIDYDLVSDYSIVLYYLIGLSIDMRAHWEIHI